VFWRRLAADALEAQSGAHHPPFDLGAIDAHVLEQPAFG
jgi:hypothetical protein